MTTEKQPAPQYRIGAVSRLTGIPPVTIRMWERRYSVTQPDRTPAGDRLYNDSDIQHLSLLKLAVSSGHSISNAAKLSTDQLEEIVGNTPAPASQNDKPVRIAIVGDLIPETLNASKTNTPNIEVVSHTSQSQLKASKTGGYHSIDVLVVELPTLDSNSFKLVSDYRQKLGATHALVIYQFGTQAHADRLNSTAVQAIRAPVPPSQIARSCIALARSTPKLPFIPNGLEQALQRPLPKQRFNGKQLAEFSQMAQAVECECPTHMSDLVRALQAFELYSEQCEGKNDDDAAVHQMLHLVTAQARRLMEDALQALVDHENPQLTQHFPNS